MPIIKSARKRVRVTRRQGVQNSKTKRGLKASIKSLHAAITGKKDVATSQNKAQSAIDKAVKKGVVSKNKAARMKKRLNAQAKAAGSGARTSSSTKAKKSPAKKVTPAKKATTKKAPTKKTAAKKK